MDYRYILFIIALVLLLFATYLELKHNPTPGMALRAIFSNRTFNENLERKRYEDKKEKFEKRGIKKFITVTYIVGFVFLALGIFLMVAPRGDDLIMSNKNEGELIGEADVTNINAATIGQNKSLASALNDINDSAEVYIRVEENSISLGEILMQDVDTLGDCLKFIDLTDKRVFLMDAYAVAVKFHEVAGKLSELGISFREGEEP